MPKPRRSSSTQGSSEQEIREFIREMTTNRPVPMDYTVTVDNVKQGDWVTFYTVTQS